MHIRIYIYAIDEIHTRFVWIRKLLSWLLGWTWSHSWIFEVYDFAQWFEVSTGRCEACCETKSGRPKHYIYPSGLLPLKEAPLHDLRESTGCGGIHGIPTQFATARFCWLCRRRCRCRYPRHNGACPVPWRCPEKVPGTCRQQFPLLFFSSHDTAGSVLYYFTVACCGIKYQDMKLFTMDPVDGLWVATQHLVRNLVAVATLAFTPFDW